MLRRFEHFEQSNHIRMLNLLEQVNLLEHLSLREIVLHVILLDCLDGNLLTRQLVHTKSDLTEGALAD